jgi:dUTP pyrophosphatase
MIFQDIPATKLDAKATLPTRAHPDDAGLDLYALEDLELAPGQGGLVRTGVAAAVPAGHAGLICDRSSLARRGLKTAAGLIDAGYRGELGVVLWNISGAVQRLKAGERVAQLLIVPVATPAVREAPSLDASARGVNGFGSTGK